MDDEVEAAVRVEAERLGYREDEFISEFMIIARAAIAAYERSRSGPDSATVKMIVEKLRLHDSDRLLNAHSVADWIEREFGEDR